MSETNTGNGILAAIVLIIMGFATLVLGNYLIFAFVDSTNSLGDYATGTLTFSGNTSCGEYVNITTAAGVLVPLYFNLTDAGCSAAPGGVATVTLEAGGNTSTFSASNLSSAINSNATLGAVLTATNSSSGVVLLTHDTVGTTGNTVATTETAANAAWGAATLTGGVAVALAAAQVVSYATTVIPLLGLGLMVLGFAVIIAILRKDGSGRG